MFVCVNVHVCTYVFMYVGVMNGGTEDPSLIVA